MADVRRMTVSELIWESKPDWKPVHKQEKRASTRPFSGSPQVSMEDPTSFERQLERFERQNLDGPDEDLGDGMETIPVDDE